MLRDTIIRGSGTSMIWKGAWVDSSAYVVNDLVENDGSSYIATQDHMSSPATEPGVGGSWQTVWDLVAQKGDTGSQGPQGPAGADGTSGADGIDGVSFIWRGIWSDSSSYIINDVVYNNGSSYISIADHDASLPTEPGDGTAWITVWNIMALKGEKGDTGPQGPQGPQGIPGVDGDSFIWRGPWSDSSSYIINDVVSNNGSSYISILNHSASFSTEPGDGTAWITVWSLMAEKGDTGDKGDQGDKGDTGDIGPQGPAGADGTDGVFDRCDQLILEMEMEFKTSYLCYYKEFTYNAQNVLTDLDIYSDSTLILKLFHKDFTYDVQKLLIQTDLYRISDGALLTSIFTYDIKKNLISIERMGYCECSSSSSSSRSSS